MQADIHIQKLISNYIEAKYELKKAGILRTDRNLQGDYAEWFVSKKFNLKLSDSTIQKGFDAVDFEGNTYQIKSRMVYSTDQSTSFDFNNIDHKFDFLIGVFFNKYLEILKIIKVSYEDVVSNVTKNKTNYRFRWHRGMSENAYIYDVTNQNNLHSN